MPALSASMPPMVNSRAEAEQFVSYMRYPPNGQRSFGPTRAVIAHGSDYAQYADESVIALAMIETADGMKNLDEIVKTPGLDGVYIGPADLTLGLTGRKYPTGFDREEPEMIDAIKTILSKAHDAGIKACLHCGSGAYAAKAIGWGFDMVTLLNDSAPPPRHGCGGKRERGAEADRRGGRHGAAAEEQQLLTCPTSSSRAVCIRPALTGSTLPTVSPIG